MFIPIFRILMKNKASWLHNNGAKNSKISKNTHFSRKCCGPHNQNIKNAPGFSNRSYNSLSNPFYAKDQILMGKFMKNYAKVGCISKNLKNTHFSRKCCGPHNQNIKNAPGFLNRSDNSPSDPFYTKNQILM